MQGTLIIRPIQGDLTRNTDLFTRMDPYVKVFLGTQHQQTRVARQQGKHPRWEDELTLHYYNQHDDDVLKFEVWDEDTHKADDFVGSGSLAVATVQLKGNKMQPWIELSYKGKSAGQILVDATFIPKNGINQQNHFQAQNPNMMMQSHYQGVYPMMSASQGMISHQDSLQQQMQQGFVRQSSYPNQGFNPQQIYGQPGFSQQMSMQPQYPSQNSFQLQQPNLSHQQSCPNLVPQQVQGQLGVSQQLQPQYRSQNSLQQPSLVNHNQGSPSQQVQVQSEIPQQVQVQPQNQQQQQQVYVKQESYVTQNFPPKENSIEFESFVLRGV